MFVEQKLMAAGFNKMEEKEDRLYFTKSILEDSENVQQICLVYNTKQQKIQSIDMFHFKNNAFLVTSSDEKTQQSLASILAFS